MLYGVKDKHISNCQIDFLIIIPKSIYETMIHSSPFAMQLHWIYCLPAKVFSKVALARVDGLNDVNSLLVTCQMTLFHKQPITHEHVQPAF